MKQPKATVFIVDDDYPVRASLQRLLGRVKLDCRSFASAEDFLEAYTLGTLGCLILDLRMPGMGGRGLQLELQRQGSLLPVLFLSAHGDVPVAVESLKTGAFDFLEKPLRGQKLLDRVREAIAYHKLLLDAQARREYLQARFDTLSPREHEVVLHVARGLTNRAISEEFGVSSQTVDVRRSKAMAKLGAGSVAELVLLVAEHDRL